MDVDDVHTLPAIQYSVSSAQTPLTAAATAQAPGMDEDGAQPPVRQPMRHDLSTTKNLSGRAAEEIAELYREQQAARTEAQLASLYGTVSDATCQVGFGALRPTAKLYRARRGASITQTGELYGTKRDMGTVVVGEADENLCYWCSGEVKRPCDVEALQHMGVVYGSLCDARLCSPACLYDAARDQAPNGRVDIAMLIESTLHHHYGNKIYRCAQCNEMIVTLYGSAALSVVPEVHSWLCESKFCSPSCVFSAAYDKLPQNRTDLITLVYEALTGAYGAQTLCYVGAVERR